MHAGSYGAVGPFGLPHVNASGRRLKAFLELNELASLTSFYRKPRYGTWLHPRSKLPHQLDHIITLQSDRKRFTDAGAWSGQLIDSDHRAVGCKLRLAVRLQRKKADARSKLARLDFSPLSDESTRQAFAAHVLQRVRDSLAPPSGADQQPAELSSQVTVRGRVSLGLPPPQLSPRQELLQRHVAAAELPSRAPLPLQGFVRGESAESACSYYPVSAGSISGSPRLCHIWLYHGVFDAFSCL